MANFTLPKNKNKIKQKSLLAENNRNISPQ